MNSPKDQSAKQLQQSLQPAPPTPEQELLQLRRQNDAMSQLMWELVRQSNPETHRAEMPTAVSDPLWQLVFVPGSKDGTTTILAGTMLPITEQEKKRVVRLLRGTNKKMEDALRELGLEFPAAYVEKQIGDYIKWGTVSHQSGWESIKPASVVESVKNLLHLPKS